MIHHLVSRGILYSIGNAINRIVPAGLFRFRIFRVFQLQPTEEDCQTKSDPPLDFQWCESDQDFRLAEQLTGFQSKTGARQLGYQACLAIDGDRPIGGLWRADEQFDEEELGVRIVLDDDQAWIFAAMVSKQHRRRGVHRRLLRYALVSDPHRHHFASINPTNRASIAAHQPFVQSTLGTCFSFRVLNVAASFSSGGLTLDRHLSLGCHERPIQMRLAADHSTA